MSSKKIITLTPKSIQEHGLLDQIQHDPLYTQSYPRALLAIFSDVSFSEKILKHFGLVATSNDKATFLEVYHSEDGTHNHDFLTLLAFVTSTIKSKPIHSAYLGLENQLHFQIGRTTSDVSSSRFEKFLELSPQADQSVGLVVDASVVACLFKAGFKINAQENQEKTFTAEEISDLRSQFLSTHMGQNSVPRIGVV